MDLVGLRHGNPTPHALPDRRDRRGMGLRGPRPDPDGPGRPAAGLRPAGGLQRPALAGAHGCPVADAADELPAVASGLPANAALAPRWLPRGDGPPPARHPALGGG